MVRVVRCVGLIAVLPSTMLLALTPACGEAVPIRKAAVAIHPDVLDAWVVGGVAGLGGEQFVKKAALDACTKAMGSGCTIYSWTMGHIVISRNNEGLLKVSDAATERGALAEARTGCDKQRQLPCEIMLRISARAKKHVPNLARNRRITASAAWLRLKPGETDLRVWIATGHSTFQAAQDAALAACQAQVVGRECDTAVNVSNGVLQTFRADEGRLGVVAESSKDRAKALALLNCKVDLSKECRLQTVYSSRTPGLFLHDYKTGRGTAI